MRKKRLNYVNVLQGTRSCPRYSNGNTLPLTQLPFGMAAFAPQTDGKTDWWFDPDYPVTEGIRLTHQPSPWIRDYGAFLFTVQADRLLETAADAWSGYDRKTSVLSPNRLRLELRRPEASFELAPGMRGALLRVSFTGGERNRWISAFTVKGEGGFTFDAKQHLVYGWTDGLTGCEAKNFRTHLVLKERGNGIDFEASRAGGKEDGSASCHLAVKPGVEQVEFDLAISYISRDMAERNAAETGAETLESLIEKDAGIWEEYLSRLDSPSSGEEEKRTFYSCLYRTGLFPHAAYEVDQTGENVHYSPYTGGVEKGIRYTDVGFWDVFRTNFPLYTRIARDLYHDVLVSLRNDYREGGWLPRWTAMGEVGCMPSTLVDSVIAQGVVCGIAERELAEELLEAMLHHATVASQKEKYGRTGILEYQELGYVPSDRYPESVNLTLDFAYGDYCIAVVAEHLDRPEIAGEYQKRAKNYRNLFDPRTGFFRPRTSDGSFEEPFDPYAWGGAFTEACAIQTFFSVPHDIEGLAELLGGKEALLRRLDQIFAEKPRYRIGGYPTEIHEMTETCEAGFGLSELSNQPGFLLPFLYAVLGEKEICRNLVKRICRELFSAEVDGFPGDEDNGSMAAWYLLAVTGEYPVCPANDRWVFF